MKKFLLKFDVNLVIILLHVLVNSAVTRYIWSLVYEHKQDTTNALFYDNLLLFNMDNSHFTTGNKICDGILNGLVMVLFIAVLSFTMIACVIYKLKKLVTAFIHCSFVVVTLVMPGTIIKDFFAKNFDLNNPYIITSIILCTLFYALAAMTAHYTDRFPDILRQYFTVFNCSAVSIFYLRQLPSNTIWTLLLAIIFWDLFAVNSSFGPLKLAIQNSGDYSEKLINFVTLTVRNNDNDSSQMENNTDTDKSETDIPADETGSDEEIVCQADDYFSGFNQIGEEERTVYDALNDSGRTTLGMGDLIMYSLLVGNAATSNCELAPAGALLGILIGLIITMSIVPDEDDDELEDNYMPALPIPLTLGMAMYFCALHMNPAFQQFTTAIV